MNEKKSEGGNLTVNLGERECQRWTERQTDKKTVAEAGTDKKTVPETEKETGVGMSKGHRQT